MWQRIGADATHSCFPKYFVPLIDDIPELVLLSEPEDIITPLLTCAKHACLDSTWGQRYKQCS